MAASRARGFTLHTVPARDGLLDEEALLAALEQTGVRVLALSWVGFATGFVADLDRIGAACRARGVWFVVDAMQGVGALPLDVHAHADRHARLRRPEVAALAVGQRIHLRAARDPRARSSPQPVSWMGVRGSDDFSALVDYDLTWRDGARRFEQITLPFQDFAGMAASLELLHELGMEADRGARRRAGRSSWRPGAERAGVEVVTPAGRRAGIVTIRPRDVSATAARLRDARVIHSVREGTIRLSPHCYTTSDEIRVALDALDG